MSIVQIFILLLLVTTANVAPVIASLLLGNRWNSPLDHGYRLPDGYPLLGPAKTIRGVCAAVLATESVALLAGFPLTFGAAFACLAMSGDICSSFVKRRLGLASSRSAPLLDQLPESLLPLWLMQSATGATLLETGVAAVIFTLVDLILSGLRRAGLPR